LVNCNKNKGKWPLWEDFLKKNEECGKKLEWMDKQDGGAGTYMRNKCLLDTDKRGESHGKS